MSVETTEIRLASICLSLISSFLFTAALFVAFTLLLLCLE